MYSADLDPMSHLSLLVFQAQQALSLDGDRLAGRHGLTSAQWKVLGALALAGDDRSAADIGRAMGLSRQAAIKQVRLLLDRGMLVQQANPKDARAPLFSLSAAGRAGFAAVDADWRRRAEELSQDLARDDLARACRLLETLLGRLGRKP